ncbi:MAG: hypothetical protein RL264_2347 [Bacteroidota bacterium]|jgi:hypothetical protein
MNKRFCSAFDKTPEGLFSLLYKYLFFYLSTIEMDSMIIYQDSLKIQVDFF